MGRKFFKTFLAGGIFGFIAGLFFAPKTGKEMREEAKKKYEEFMKFLEEKEVDKKIEKIFGEVSEKTKEAYFTAQMSIVEALAELKGALDELDKEKYAKLLEEKLKEVKEKLGVSEEAIKKMKTKFVRESRKFKKLAEKLKKEKGKKTKRTKKTRKSSYKKK